MVQMPQIEKITSRENRRLVAARRVRDGRDADRIFIEGKRLAKEALTAGIAIEQSFVSDSFDDGELVRDVGERAPHTAVLPGQLFRSISDTKSPQGIALIARRPMSGPLPIDMSAAVLPLAICLVEVNNPANLGAVVRTVEAAGAAGMITTEGSTDPFSSKALRAGMGGTFRLPIWANATLNDAVDWARQKGMRLTAAALDGERSYLDIDWISPRLLVLGSEARGLAARELDTFDERIHIPMEPAVESLNLAVAAGVLLFEARTQVMHRANG